jgi:soluble lytic murein transglycosylase
MGGQAALEFIGNDQDARHDGISKRDLAARNKIGADLRFFSATIAVKRSAMHRRRFLLLLVFGLGVYLIYIYWRDHRFDAEIAAAAARYQVDPALVKAVIWQESRFNPNDRGRAGELGLMQIREAAAFEWASDEHIAGFEHAACLDPATNTLAGTWYLKSILLRYKQADDPLPYALADYNAGRGNVLKWRTGSAMTNSAAFIEQIRFPGTKAYVRSILKRYEYYR